MVVIICATCAYGQQYGPVPPRPQQFPGATLIQPARANFRQRFTAPRVPESFQAVEHHPPTRSRRPPQTIRKGSPLLIQHQILEQPKANLIEEVPVQVQFTNAISTPIPQFQPVTSRALTPRPVQEDVHEEEARTVLSTPTTTAYPSSIRGSYQPTPTPVVLHPAVAQPQVPPAYQKPQYLQPSAFRTQHFQPEAPVAVPVTVTVPVPAPAPEAIVPARQIIRQQIRPVQQAALPINRPPVPQSVLAPQTAVTSQPVQEEEYFRQVQGRPLKKQEPVRQQIIEREHYKQYPSKPTEVINQQPVSVQRDYTKPVPRQPHVKAPTKERKPVAQTIRKYHEEHEDGSITWGYENDDGSFKEETIGTDCVTRGKYGYYDPDGVKREYTYETGIPCVKENEEAESSLHGYIDYTNNKYVFPNGDEIDLESMVKNRARKPVGQYRVRS
ncbi:hypothetical protein RUM44_012467 [Polyplax serrata]|uniref:Uncharacterized protein n=1 Tax=Polyplax serrata TaxID=468196 RepID=A0ABR1BBE7_POLSC